MIRRDILLSWRDTGIENDLEECRSMKGMRKRVARNKKRINEKMKCKYG